MKTEPTKPHAKAGRKLHVCDFCGGWWESPELETGLKNYIFGFFADLHTRCPRPADSRHIEVSVSLVRESEAAFKLVDAAKEWKPEQWAEYRPPQKPSSKASESVAAGDLVGWWTTVNLKGGCPECWRFDKDGAGLLGVYSIACCEFKFQWRLAHPNQICLKLLNPEPDPPLDFFFSGSGSLAMQDRTDARGRRSRVLSIKRSKVPRIELLRHNENPWKLWKDSWK